MAMGSLVWTLLALGSGAGTGPSAVLLDVGLVRVSPLRPGTNQPWDPATEKPQKDNCGAIGLLGAAIGLAGTPIAAVHTAGLAETFCKAMSGVRESTKAPAPTDPNLFVRLVASRDVAYRSYTAHNTTSHVFHFRVAVPLDAVPSSGLELYVQNDRGVGSDDSHEVIGSLRLHRKDLVGALNGDGLLRLDDKSGGLDRIEIAVSEAEVPKVVKAQGNLSKFALFRLEGLDLPAGIVAEVGESGTYQLEQLGAFTPVGRGASQLNFQDPAFRNAPHGVGIAAVGEGGHVATYVVGPCARFVVSAPGAVVVGVNSRGQRSGTVAMQVASRLATAEEWRTGKTAGKCKAPAEPALAAASQEDLAASESPAPGPEVAAPSKLEPEAWSGPVVAAVQKLVQDDGSKVALAMQRILHPTGNDAALQAFDYVAGRERVIFRFATSWRGALGARHVTTVAWEIGPEGHRRAAVKSDTAPVKAGPRNLQELNGYFATKLYPMIAQNPAVTY